MESARGLSSGSACSLCWSLIAGAALMALSGCPQNPYDPTLPEDQQLPGAVVGRLLLDDVEARPVTVRLEHLPNSIDDRRDDLSTTTRTNNDDLPPGLEGEVPGTFWFTDVVPGHYRVRFLADDEGNGREATHEDASSFPFDVAAGSVAGPIELEPELIPAQVPHALAAAELQRERQRHDREIVGLGNRKEADAAAKMLEQRLVMEPAAFSACEL